MAYEVGTMSPPKMIISKNSLFSLLPLNLKNLSPRYGPLWTSKPNEGHRVKTQPHPYCVFEWTLTDAETGAPHGCLNNRLPNSLEKLGLIPQGMLTTQGWLELQPAWNPTQTSKPKPVFPSPSVRTLECPHS